MTLPRRNERQVILRFSPTDVLTGSQFWEHPELPSLIDAPAVGICWYREVWERAGWTVEVSPQEAKS